MTVLVALAKRLAFLACGSQTEREKCKKSQTIIRRENERIVKEKEKEEKRHKYRRVNLQPTTHNAFFNIYLPVLLCENLYLPWAPFVFMRASVSQVSEVFRLETTPC